MTRDELIEIVPVRQWAGEQFVALSDIPQPWREEFWIALAGLSMPKPLDGDIHCAYARDWLRWVKGSPLNNPGPSGLEDLAYGADSHYPHTGNNDE